MLLWLSKYVPAMQVTDVQKGPNLHVLHTRKGRTRDINTASGSLSSPSLHISNVMYYSCINFPLTSFAFRPRRRFIDAFSNV